MRADTQKRTLPDTFEKTVRRACPPLDISLFSALLRGRTLKSGHFRTLSKKLSAAPVPPLDISLFSALLRGRTLCPDTHCSPGGGHTGVSLETPCPPSCPEREKQKSIDRMPLSEAGVEESGRLQTARDGLPMLSTESKVLGTRGDRKRAKDLYTGLYVGR